MIESRELLLAVPGDTTDIYARHQQVWAAIAPNVRSGQEFLYRQESPRLIRVRSNALPNGKPVMLRDGWMRLDAVVSDRYDRNKERDVPEDQAVAWISKLVQNAGFDIRSIELERYLIVTGRKPSKEGVPGHRIRYSTATFRMDLAVNNPFEAQQAWRQGIGRGRRFGFGMLVHAQ